MQYSAAGSEKHQLPRTQQETQSSHVKASPHHITHPLTHPTHTHHLAYAPPSSCMFRLQTFFSSLPSTSKGPIRQHQILVDNGYSSQSLILPLTLAAAAQYAKASSQIQDHERASCCQTNTNSKNRKSISCLTHKANQRSTYLCPGIYIIAASLCLFRPVFSSTSGYQTHAGMMTSLYRCSSDCHEDILPEIRTQLAVAILKVITRNFEELPCTIQVIQRRMEIFLESCDSQSRALKHHILLFLSQKLKERYEYPTIRRPSKVLGSYLCYSV
jgi:hypothetical protein